MLKANYDEIVQDGSANARQRECSAIAHSIALLVEAQDSGVKSKETVLALHFGRRLWEMLLMDLASAENGLPNALKADLISVGIGILRELEEIRQERTDNYNDVIYLSRVIMEGLK